MPDDDNEKSLLKPGQTVEDWWHENGTDMNEARSQRAAEYVRQRETTLPRTLASMITRRGRAAE